MSALVPFRESIESSAALFDGVVVNNADAEVLENLAKHEHTATLLTQPPRIEVDSAQSPVSILHLQGCIEGVALVYCKQTRAQALMALKADLVRTILHRFDIVVEESERIDQATKSKYLLNLFSGAEWTDSKAAKFRKITDVRLCLPRRVIFSIDFPEQASQSIVQTRKAKKKPARRKAPLPNKSVASSTRKILFCDYLLPEETIEESRDRCSELLNTSLSDKFVSAQEKFPTDATPIQLAKIHQASQNEVPSIKKCGVSNTSSPKTEEHKELHSSMLALIGIVGILLLLCLVVLLYMRP